MLGIRAVLYFTKGLSHVVKGELIDASSDARIVEETERFIVVDIVSFDASRLVAKLRTVDDVRLLLAGPKHVGSPSDFDAMCADASLEIERAYPESLAIAEWSLTLAARKPCWRTAPQWDPVERLARNWPEKRFSTEWRCALDLRIQADGSAIHLSVNAWPHFTKRRSASGRPGALKPTVAAALVRCAQARIGCEAGSMLIYDPFCGTGTILVEAAAVMHPVRGSDIDPKAIAIAVEQLGDPLPPSGAERGSRVFVRDALSGFPPLPEATAVVSNLPWGKQIDLNNPAALYKSLASSTARVVNARGVCVYLTTDPDRLCSFLRKQCDDCRIVLTKLGLLGQSPTIVEVFKP